MPRQRSPQRSPVYLQGQDAENFTKKGQNLSLKASKQLAFT